MIVILGAGGETGRGTIQLAREQGIELLNCVNGRCVAKWNHPHGVLDQRLAHLAIERKDRFASFTGEVFHSLRLKTELDRRARAAGVKLSLQSSRFREGQAEPGLPRMAVCGTTTLSTKISLKFPSPTIFGTGLTVIPGSTSGSEKS